MKTGPITVNIVLLARNNRTILIQHPILSHFQAIKRFKPDQIFKIFGFPGISPGFSYFSTVGIFSVPFRNDPIVLIWDNFMVFLPQAFYNLWKMFHQFIFQSLTDCRRPQTDDRHGHIFRPRTDLWNYTRTVHESIIQFSESQNIWKNILHDYFFIWIRRQCNCFMRSWLFAKVGFQIGAEFVER